MCLNMTRVIKRGFESLQEYRDRCRIVQAGEFPCRMCTDCLKSAVGRVRGDFIAEKMVAQRVLVCLLTYNPEYVREAGRDVEMFLQDIPGAADDGTVFIRRFRTMFARLHPEMILRLKSYRVPEIAVRSEDRGVNPDLPWRERYAALDRRMPLEKPAQVHLHLALFLSVEWKDAERQAAGPALWSDDLIPHLKLDWLYDHWWESKAEASARGGRICKAVRPWPWGFIGYENPKGGEGDYFAKYISKCMMMREEWAKAGGGRGWSAEKIRDYERAELSWRKTRKSPGIGHKYYALQGEMTAKAGLPPCLSFTFGLVDGAAEVVGRSPHDGGLPYRRAVTRPSGEQFLDGNGRLVVSTIKRRVPLSALLQRPGRQRKYFSGYDAAWEAANGDREPPRRPVMRQTTVNGRTEAVVAYGVPEAREAVAKYEDGLLIAKRDRRLARERRSLRRSYPAEMSGVELREYYANPLWRFDGKVSNELVNEGLMPVQRNGRGKFTRLEVMSLVRAWTEKVERECLRKQGLDRTNATDAAWYSEHLYAYLRDEVALWWFSADEVGNLARLMRREQKRRHAIGPRIWRAWRKGRLKAGTICG